MDSAADAEFSAFMMGRWARLVRLGYGLTGDPQLAEDLAQTALTRAYASWARVRRSGHPDAAGFAAVLAAAVAVPLLTGGPAVLRPAPAAGGAPARRDSAAGGIAGHVIARGTTTGQRWTMRLSREHGTFVASAPGVTGALPVFAPRQHGDPALVSASYGGINGRLVMITAGLRANVTSLAFHLAGQPARHPVSVSVAGRRWMGLVLPKQARVTKIVASGRHGELAYAVPFGQDGLKGILNLYWLPAGQPAPARHNIPVPTLIAGHGAAAFVRGRVVIEAGPWGRCIGSLMSRSGPICTQPPYLSAFLHGGVLGLYDYGGSQVVPRAPGPGQYEYLLLRTSRKVSRVDIRLTDGTGHTLRPVTAGPDRYLAIVISDVGIARWTAFDASGHQVGSGTGASVNAGA